MNTTTKTLSNEVKDDILALMTSELESWKADALAYCEPEDESDAPYLELTIACSDDGQAWSYQTGDNSYTGGAYSLPHWAVTSIDLDTTMSELYAEIVSQLEELLAY